MNANPRSTSHEDADRSEFRSLSSEKCSTPPSQECGRAHDPKSSFVSSRDTANHRFRTPSEGQELQHQSENGDDEEGGTPGALLSSASRTSAEHPEQEQTPKRFLGRLPFLLAQAWEDALKWSEAHSFVREKSSGVDFVLVSGRYGPYGEGVLIYAIRAQGTTKGYILYDSISGCAFYSPSLIGVIHKYNHYCRHASPKLAGS